MPLSSKFLTHSLISSHHDLNLGEGSPALVGEVKGTSGLDTSIPMRFSFLKPKEATTTGKVKVEWWCPNTPWSNQINERTYRDYKLGFHILFENVPECGKERHRQQKKVLLQSKECPCNDK